jgi:hypothetical protein
VLLFKQNCVRVRSHRFDQFYANLVGFPWSEAKAVKRSDSLLTIRR